MPHSTPPMKRRNKRFPASKARGIRLARLMDDKWGEGQWRKSWLADAAGAAESGGRRLASRWLEGEGISEQHLERIAEYFGTTAAWILTGTGPQYVNAPAADEDADLEAASLAELEKAEGAKGDRRALGEQR